MLQNPKHEFSGEGDYIVKLDVKDSDGCYKSFAWSVYNTGIDNRFEIAPSSGEICLNETITGSGVSGPRINNIQWDLDNGVVLGSQNISYIYPTSGSYDLSLAVSYNFNQVATRSCFADFQKNNYR